VTTAPEVSVVCSTYRRAGRLPGLVAALEAQTLDPSRFEVVIVDNGTTDDTAAALERLAATTTIDLRVVRVDVNRGPSRGRNAGWQAARAPLIAFTDDDCIPTPEWLEAGMRAVEAHGRPVVVVGRTKPNPDQAANRGPFSRTQDIRNAKHLQTCNIFYSRQDLADVGGLDEKIAAKGGEYTDLGWRVLDRGRDAVFAEDAVVFHDVSTSSFRAAVKEAVTWVDVPRVAAIHPKRARAMQRYGIFWKPSHPSCLLALVGLTMALFPGRRWAVLAVGPWMRFRLRRSPIGKGRRQAVQYLPHAFVLDALEISTMVRGSIKHRTLVL
jgi:GT2 family glycosyltransferase